MDNYLKNKLSYLEHRCHDCKNELKEIKERKALGKMYFEDPIKIERLENEIIHYQTKIKTLKRS